MVSALQRRSLRVRLLLTGQHPLALADYGLLPDFLVQLDWPAGTTPRRAAEAAAAAIQPVLGWTSLVLVQGDTSSALAGALGAKLRKIPIAHVEAGLRSHNSAQPWPEEDFRVEIDRFAALLFAPTPLNAANLRREGVHGEVHVTGNTASDAVLAKAPPPRERSAQPKMLVTCHRRESWGEGLERVAEALRRIAAQKMIATDFVLHPNPHVAGEMRRLLGEPAAVRLLEPCTHEEMLSAMQSVDLVLSDSGGMQEEAATLGVPLLVLRDATERPEAIVSGNMKLVGTDPERIVRAVRRLMNAPELLSAMRGRSMPYGDGDAADRIGTVIAEWLNRRMIGETAAPLQRLG